MSPTRGKAFPLPTVMEQHIDKLANAILIGSHSLSLLHGGDWIQSDQRHTWWTPLHWVPSQPWTLPLSLASHRESTSVWSLGESGKRGRHIRINSSWPLWKINLEHLSGEFHAGAKLKAAQDFLLALPSLCQVPSLFPAPFPGFFQIKYLSFELQLPKYTGLQLPGLNLILLLLAHEANHSRVSARPWVPKLLTAFVQLHSRANDDNHQASQSHKQINHYRPKHKDTQNSEKPYQISRSFPKGFGLVRWTAEIRNSSLWLFKKKKKQIHNFPPHQQLLWFRNHITLQPLCTVHYSI